MENWSGRPRQKPSMSFALPMISYHPSSITRPKPPLPKDYKPDPREANLMTYQLNKMPNDKLVRGIAEVPRVRFFTKYQGENVDPDLLNTNYKQIPPFPHIKRPQPPPFPLPLFDLETLERTSSKKSSDVSRFSMPKPPSFIREYSREDRYDADRLDRERKGALFSRRSAKTQLNVKVEKEDPNKKRIIPLAQQVRHWEQHLREKSSKEKLADKREKEAKEAAIALAKAKRKEARAAARRPRPEENDLIHRMVRESRKFQTKAHLELSTLFNNLPQMVDFPTNATIKKVEEAELEHITPSNVDDVLNRDKKEHKKVYNYKRK